MANDYQRQPRRKYCQFCKEGVEYIDYKDTQLLRKYMTDRGKIKPRRVTGACTHARSTSTTSPAPSSALARWPCSRTPSPLSPPVVAAVAVAAATSPEGEDPT